MICDLCTTDISGGALCTVPCCNRTFHTVCTISHVSELCSHAYYNSQVNITCVCGITLYTQQQHGNMEVYEDAGNNATTLLAMPAVKADLKVVKKKQGAMTKGRAAFAKVLREKTLEFKAATEPHLQQIKEIKTSMTHQLKATPEYKESTKCRRMYEGTLNAFKNKHNMTRATLREVLGSNAYYRYRYSNDSACMLRRRFRIRI